MLFLGERFSRLAWLGTVISFAGMGLIALGEGEGFSLDQGALLILGAALCTAHPPASSRSRCLPATSRSPSRPGTW